LAAGYRCVEYLEDTKYLVLEYGGTANPLPVFNITNDLKDPPNEPVFVVASDAAFADDERTRKSTEGMALMLFGGIFDWLSRL
jgi:hypothetical protein